MSKVLEEEEAEHKPVLEEQAASTKQVDSAIMAMAAQTEDDGFNCEVAKAPRRNSVLSAVNAAAHQRSQALESVLKPSVRAKANGPASEFQKEDDDVSSRVAKAPRPSVLSTVNSAAHRRSQAFESLFSGAKGQKENDFNAPVAKAPRRSVLSAVNSAAYRRSQALETVLKAPAASGA